MTCSKVQKQAEVIKQLDGRILGVLGGSRAFTGCPRLPEGGPSGLAGAPKVASAPRGPPFSPLAGNPAQSLPLGQVLALYPLFLKGMD